MKIKDGFVLKCVDGAYTVVDSGGKAAIPVSVHSAFLWELLQEKPVTKSEMLEALLTSFNISTVLALGEIDNFLRMMRENEIIE